MRDVLFEYNLNPTTWAYISSLMIIGIFFKFHRFFSVRNLDIIGLIALAPGLLLVTHQKEQLGYVWLFCVGGFFLVRLLVDPLMVRRPFLEPNLSAAGLTFTAAALLVFLLANVVTSRPTQGDLEGARRLEQILARKQVPIGQSSLDQYGPGYPFFYVFASFANKAFLPLHEGDSEQARREELEVATARMTAILAHLALVAALIVTGLRHFDNIHTGVAAAALYLLLPYTAQMTSRVDNIVPAALLTWAAAAYRRPMIAGVLVGLAGGVIYYPLFLLPLWCGFYWQRGMFRFLGGTALALGLLIASLSFTSSDAAHFAEQMRQMFGFRNPLEVQLSGFWEYHDRAFRIPVMVAFVALCGSLAIWPPQKNFGTLVSCSAAVMLGTQFWHVQHGGIYMAWYLPLLILTVFRPNLEDRVARSAVIDRPAWWRRWLASRRRPAAGGRANGTPATGEPTPDRPASNATAAQGPSADALAPRGGATPLPGPTVLPAARE